MEENYTTVDLGTAPDEAMGEVAAPKKFYPSLYVNGVDMPPLPEGEFYAKVKLRKKSYTKDYEDGTSSCSFDVLELHTPKVENPEDYDNRNPIEKNFDEGIAIIVAQAE